MDENLPETLQQFNQFQKQLYGFAAFFNFNQAINVTLILNILTN